MGISTCTPYCSTVCLCLNNSLTHSKEGDIGCGPGVPELVVTAHVCTPVRCLGRVIHVNIGCEFRMKGANLTRIARWMGQVLLRRGIDAEISTMTITMTTATSC